MRRQDRQIPDWVVWLLFSTAWLTLVISLALVLLGMTDGR